MLAAHRARGWLETSLDVQGQGRPGGPRAIMPKNLLPVARGLVQPGSELRLAGQAPKQNDQRTGS